MSKTGKSLGDNRKWRTMVSVDVESESKLLAFLQEKARANSTEAPWYGFLDRVLNLVAYRAAPQNTTMWVHPQERFVRNVKPGSPKSNKYQSPDYTSYIILNDFQTKGIAYIHEAKAYTSKLSVKNPDPCDEVPGNIREELEYIYDDAVKKQLVKQAQYAFENCSQETIYVMCTIGIFYRVVTFHRKTTPPIEDNDEDIPNLHALVHGGKWGCMVVEGFTDISRSFKQHLTRCTNAIMKELTKQEDKEDDEDEDDKGDEDNKGGEDNEEDNEDKDDKGDKEDDEDEDDKGSEDNKGGEDDGEDEKD
ncbi:predicted protein [Postia placenta Mad-698-R]|nr:predicted protein [Postia placenta Mad-698-R]